MERRWVNGATIRELREQVVRERQDEFAVRCGFTPSYINHIEQGRKQPSPVALARIAHALGVRIGVISCVLPACDTCSLRESA